MINDNLWKYCTTQHCHEMLLSFNLFENTDIAAKRQIGVLYALSNNTEKHYQKISIPKQDGSTRQLLVPDGLLKQVQVNLLHNVLEQIPVSASATAYKKGASIRLNAAPHCRQPLVLKLDIKAFFDHITYPMIYTGAFPAVAFPPPVRTLLTHLCCCYDKLPQGAPTSAALANLVLRPFDDLISDWCHPRQITYTRYCDDLTFSGDFDPETAIAKVRNGLNYYGFYLNESKTRILTGSHRQSVTGIVVNDKVQCSRAYRRQVRQAVHYCQKYGVDAHLKYLQESDALPVTVSSSNYLSSLLGKTNYILQINPQDGAFIEAKKWLADQIT